MGSEQIVILADRIAGALERIASALEQESSSIVSSIAPEALSKEDAARFIGEDVSAIDNLIRTRKLEYVQHGNQRGRVITVKSLRSFLEQHRQATGEEMMGKRKKA